MSRSGRLPTPPPKVAAVLAVAAAASAALAMRDLAGRPSGTVRGGKKLWRVLIVANPGNSLAYWVFGRR